MTAPYLRRFEPLLGGDWFAIGGLLVLAPHPDDEVLGCGGLIMAHTSRGHSVTVVVMTDGGLGDRGRAGDASYREARRAESRAAAAVMGGVHLRFLDFPDGRLAAEASAPDVLRDVILDVAPRTVVFPSPFEVHPDHRATAVHAAAALARVAPPARVLACEIGAAMPSNVLLDITGDMARKEQAVGCYRSQLVHQDLVLKLRAQNRARTVNVDDRAIEYVEAYTVIAHDQIVPYFQAAEGAVRLIDAMGPRVPC